MIREKLQLNRKFLVIESPIPFEIYCPEQDDGVKRRQGSWQMTIHDLLTKSHYPLNPIYNLELIYDETLLAENETVSWYTTDLNLGDALRGIDGQLVTWNYNERLGVTNVFNSVNGRGIPKYFYKKDFFSEFLGLFEHLEVNESLNILVDNLKVKVDPTETNDGLYMYGGRGVFISRISNKFVSVNITGAYFNIYKNASNNLVNRLYITLERLDLEYDNQSRYFPIAFKLSSDNLIEFEFYL